ncbi:F-box/kelch-repeat protein [Apostasia shenzhenica]|uniref:F-box/kelch-repeat protein n=1 Tax=Apostasia shenzhenica TaxID=1088818 RepID=A0A2I0A2Q1_9ASPA|nr:F-box/kelch-repeat protein [Apostasia shenzhenica]
MTPSREQEGFICFQDMAMTTGRRPTVAEMPPEIWGRLPEHLLDRILTLLPLRCLLSLRPTCKRFRSLLLSPSFLSQLHAGRRERGAVSAYLILAHPQFSHRFLPLYDSAADSWRKLPISISSSSSWQLLSSSCGLLCFSTLQPPASLLVYNLLSLSSKLIPSPIQSYSSATLITSRTPYPHGYRIFLSSSFHTSFYLYDSNSLSWTCFPIVEPLLTLANSLQDPVFFNGFLYFTTTEPFSVLGFDLSAERWETEVALEMPPELVFVRLVNSGGGKRLFLVGGVGRDGISRSLKVWEMLPGERPRWEEIGRLPELMCRKFLSVCYHNYSHVYCLWHEGMICICCTTWPEVLFLRVARGTWHWLPRCPLLQEKWSCGFRWFSFAPDLYAIV